MNAETNANEVVQALRVLCAHDGKSCTGNCKPCPADQFRKNHPSEACDDGTMTAAFILIESLTAHIDTKTTMLDAAIAGQETLQKALTASQRRAQDARNELCQRCGRYHEAHKGACDGCRWRDGYAER